MNEEQEDEFSFNNSLENASFEAPQLHLPKKSHTYVWHEMGHIFGHIIAENLGSSFGKIGKVNFGKSPHVIFSENEFKLKGQPTPGYDFYGQSNDCYTEQDLEKIKAASLNTKKALCYILYLIRNLE